MSVIGIIIFAIGWIYAISSFGFFLGVGIGWIPALFIAWILDFVLTIILGIMGASMSSGRKNR